jgi:hypothetical protein
MCIYKSYFEKNNTIVYNSEINTAKNQVTEIVYGNNPNVYSRFIFKLDLTGLINKINTEEISVDRILSHRLKLYNTINELNQYIGSDIGYNNDRVRASSFELILFEIDEEWDEGSGYDISFDRLALSRPKKKSASNWFNKKTNLPWTTEGIYNEGNPVNILDTIDFDNGDENIDIEITEYINDIVYSGSIHNGLGLAFTFELEDLTDTKLNSVAFHTKYTNTYFEPHLETIFDNVIKDDRNCFKLDEDNRLYLYAKRGQDFLDINALNVNIYNHKYELIYSLSGSDIKKQSKGIYYIELMLSSDEHIDSVIYYDEWLYEYNLEQKTIENEFYLVENTTNFLIETILPKNIINVSLSGLFQDQKIKRGENLIIDLIIKKLYKQTNSFPLNFEYRVFIQNTNNKQFEVIPFTEVNRAPNKYFIKLNTNILIPYKYFLEIKLKNVDYTLNYKNVQFIVVD